MTQVSRGQKGEALRAGTIVDDGVRTERLRRGLYLDVGLHLVALLIGGAHPLDAEVRGGPGGEHLVPMCLSALGSSAKMPDSAGPGSRSWTGLRAYRDLLRPKRRTVGDEWRCLRRLLWLEVPSRLPQDHSPTELFTSQGYETNVSHFPVLPEPEHAATEISCLSKRRGQRTGRSGRQGSHHKHGDPRGLLSRGSR